MTTPRRITPTGRKILRSFFFCIRGLRSPLRLCFHFASSYLKIERMRKFFTALLRDEGGQAFVEYILGLSMAVVVVGAMARSFRTTLWALWRGLAKDIIAACPGCPATLK